MSKKAILFLILGATTLTAKPCEKYSRNSWKHWIDVDKDCQDTRQEILIRDSRKKVTYVGADSYEGCKVKSGKWFDPYTGKTFTDPKQLDVDHVVPLKEAFESGGWKWDRQRRAAYANYMKYEYHLLPVYRGSNRSKGAKDLAEWSPENKKFLKQYAKIWVKIKLDWDLSADHAELVALRRILGKNAKLPGMEEEYTCK